MIRFIKDLFILIFKIPKISIMIRNSLIPFPNISHKKNN
jgi:hypothetical protein